jgi:antitoxin component YwqK of YwqJK toxin-antitoxin module
MVNQNDNLVGVVKIYYDKEEKHLQESYFQINGVKEGSHNFYYENGEIETICNYE